MAGAGKNQILSAYVNGVAMGGNIYGVEAASRTYFGIPSSDLDLAQAALLAAVQEEVDTIDAGPLLSARVAGEALQNVAARLEHGAR